VLVRLVLVAFAAVAALGVATAVGARAGRNAGLLAGVALALLAAASPLQGDDPNTEQFGIAFLAGAWGLATLPGTAAAAGAGVAIAAGAAFNPLFAMVVPVIGVELVASRRGEGVKRLAIAIGAGLALLWIVLVWVRAELQSYTFPRHFYIALPGIAAGIAIGVASVWPRDLLGRAALVALVLALPVVAYVAGPQLRQLELPADRRWSLETRGLEPELPGGAVHPRSHPAGHADLHDRRTRRGLLAGASTGADAILRLLHPPARWRRLARAGA